MPKPVALDRHIRGELQPLRGDAEIAALAKRQHGVVGRAQLSALGLGSDAIDHRIAAGRLHAVHRGVYAVGHPLLAPEGRWLAGVLAAGPDAVLSRRSAAALWDLGPEFAGPVEVTAPRCLRSRPGLRVSRATFADDERTRRSNIPVTTPARTLLDLAAVLPRHALERAAEAAEQLGACDVASLDALLTRYRGRKGVRALRQIADTGRASRITRSELEARFLAFLDRFVLPPPQTNVRIRVGGRTLEVDCVWPAARVVVELDGHAYHATRAAFERDRERDRLLQAAGWRVIRITWRQLRDEPRAIARDLHRLLRAGCT